jgi:hypothetical protein
MRSSGQVRNCSGYGAAENTGIAEHIFILATYPEILHAEHSYLSGIEQYRNTFDAAK